MKKALFLLEDLSYSGSTLTMLHIIKALPDYVEPYVFVMSTLCDDDVARYEEYKQVTNNVILAKYPHSMSKKFKIDYYIYVRKLRKQLSIILKDNEYKWLISHNYFIAGYIFKHFKNLNIKKYFYSLSEVRDISKLFFINCINNYNRKLIARYSDAFIAVSNKCYDSKYITKRKMLTLYDYSDLPIKKNLKIFSNDNTIRIGQIGYFDNNKNQLFTLRLIKELKDSGYCVEGHFLGYIPNQSLYFDEMKLFINKNKLNNNVFFYDKKYSKIAFFDKIDILLLPSISEGFGIVAIEAQNRKVFVLASSNVTNELGLDNLSFINLSSFDDYLIFLKEQLYKRNLRNVLPLKEQFISKCKMLFE